MFEFLWIFSSKYDLFVVKNNYCNICLFIVGTEKNITGRIDSNNLYCLANPGLKH